MSSTSSCLLNTLVLRIMSFKTIKEKPKKERTDRRTDSLTVFRSSRKSPQFSRKTSPNCSRPRSAEELPAIIIVVVIASSICEREREQEELHLPQLQTKKRTLFSHNRASGPVRRVKYPQADLHVRFSSAHQVRLVGYTIARLPSTRVCSNNDPPS